MSCTLHNFLVRCNDASQSYTPVQLPLQAGVVHSAAKGPEEPRGHESAQVCCELMTDSYCLISRYSLRLR